MTIPDKIKSFFKRAKPPKIADKKPPAAAGEKSAKTTQPQKKAPKATVKK